MTAVTKYSTHSIHTLLYPPCQLGILLESLYSVNAVEIRLGIPLLFINESLSFCCAKKCNMSFIILLGMGGLLGLWGGFSFCWRTD